MMTFSELWKHFRLIGDPTALSKEELAFLERFLTAQYELREKKRIRNALINVFCPRCE